MRKQLIGLAVSIGLMVPSTSVLAEETFFDWVSTFSRMKEVKPIDNEVYLEECGSCHFAYPPGLHTSESWSKLLNADALSDHFGENAELDEDTLSLLNVYVLENAAEKSYYKRSRKITRAAATMDSAPLRITENVYIKRKHHEIPDKMMKDNPDVMSHSNCNACHTQAEKGIFDDDTVDIPNFADWDD